MQTYRLTIEPQTAFGTPLVGDTLFGQLCWALHYQLGNDALESLLEGYTTGSPFIVLSDAFPKGYVPLPALPSRTWGQDDKTDIKALKKRRWLPLDALDTPLPSWQQSAKNDREVDAGALHTMQPHNTINRATGTTGTGMFAPFNQPQTWYHQKTGFHLYAVLDESRLDKETLMAAIRSIGQSGYGRDAGTGLGKFSMTAMEPWQWQRQSGTTCMTLASCAPQGLGIVPTKSYYQTQVRFGRHGDVAARGKNPFKRPLLMTKAGAVFTLQQAQDTPWIGQGIGNLSFYDARTVHQGYAPVIYLPAIEGGFV